MAAAACSEKVAAAVFKTVEDVSTKIPKSHALNRVALDIASGLWHGQVKVGQAEMPIVVGASSV